MKVNIVTRPTDGVESATSIEHSDGVTLMMHDASTIYLVNDTNKVVAGATDVLWFQIEE